MDKDPVQWRPTVPQIRPSIQKQNPSSNSQFIPHFVIPLDMSPISLRRSVTHAHIV